MLSKKVHKRLGLVVLNAARNLLPLFFGMVLSLFVVRLLSPDLWGKFVSVQIWVFLLVHLASWGNTQHLLINFSKKPADVTGTWSKNLTSRLPLLVFTLLLLLLPVSPEVKLLAIAWAVFRCLAQSFEAPILFYTRFSLSIIADAALHIVLFLLLYLFIKDIEIVHLIAGMAAIEMLKTFVYSVAFKKFIFAYRFSFSRKELKRSLPFFLLGFSGLLQSKIDLYLVSAMLPAYDVSLYQIYIALLFLLLGIPNLIIIPFAKNLYRLGTEEFAGLRKNIALIALPALLLGIPATWFILHYFYLFELDLALLVGGAFFILPVFFYSPLIHQMFRLGKQNMVVTINFCGFALVFIPGLFLVNFFGITGALAAAAANQWAILAAYYYISRNFLPKATNNKPELNFVTETQS